MPSLRQNQTSRYVLTDNDAYFAGTHVKVFFGPIWVDEIVTIQWDLVNNKAPIYGYASEFYDAIAKGTIIVNGSFTIAFRKLGYLNNILNQLRKLDPGLIRGISDAQKSMGAVNAVSRAIFELQGNRDKLSMQAPTMDMILAKMTEKGSAPLDYLSDRLENVIYGQKSKISRVPHPDEYDKTGDIINSNRISKGFDILLEYGNPNSYSNEHTAYTINDIHITGFGQIAAPTGEPIGERYTFFARNMNETIPHRFTIPEVPEASAETARNEEVEKQVEAIVSKDTDKPSPPTPEQMSEPQNSRTQNLHTLSGREQSTDVSQEASNMVIVATKVISDNQTKVTASLPQGWRFVNGGPTAQLIGQSTAVLSPANKLGNNNMPIKVEWNITHDYTTDNPSNYLELRGFIEYKKDPVINPTRSYAFIKHISYSSRSLPDRRTRRQGYGIFSDQYQQ